MISNTQVQNIIRHVGSFAAGGITIGATFAVLNASQAADGTSALKELIDGLSQAADGAFKLGVVVGPVIAGIMAKWGSHAVSSTGALKTVDAIEPAGSVKVLVAPDAPPAAQDAAADKAQPNIVAIPPPAAVKKTAAPH